GEMPAAALQERLASIVASAPNSQFDPDNIRILAGDLIEEGGVGNLASAEVQAELDPWLNGADLLIADNLSSLTAVVRGNEAGRWGSILDWVLRLLRRGEFWRIGYHAVRVGDQRGSKPRRDVL